MRTEGHDLLSFLLISGQLYSPNSMRSSLLATWVFPEPTTVSGDDFSVQESTVLWDIMSLLASHANVVGSLVCFRLEPSSQLIYPPNRFIVLASTCWALSLPLELKISTSRLQQIIQPAMPSHEPSRPVVLPTSPTSCSKTSSYTTELLASLSQTKSKLVTDHCRRSTLLLCHETQVHDCIPPSDERLH